MFIAGLPADQLGRRVHLPRVTPLPGSGLVVGNSGLDLLPAEIHAWYELSSITGLTMFAFLPGSTLTAEAATRAERAVLSVSLAVVLASLTLVDLGPWVLGAPWELALVLAAISTATTPAATRDVIRQSGRTGDFVKTSIRSRWTTTTRYSGLSFIGVMKQGRSATLLTTCVSD